MTGRSTLAVWALLGVLVAVLAVSEYRAAARTFARVHCVLAVHVAEFGGAAPDPYGCGRAG